MTTGKCRDCRHWATADNKVGDCTLAELTPAESLHVAIVYRREQVSKHLHASRRYIGDDYKGGLLTDAEFGCISFDHGPDAAG
jgi:hypothetical protein